MERRQVDYACLLHVLLIVNVLANPYGEFADYDDNNNDKRCTYSFTVSGKDAATLCQKTSDYYNSGFSSDAASPNYINVPPPVVPPTPDTGATSKLLLTVNKLLKHQNVLDKQSTLEKDLGTLKTLLSTHSDKFEALADKISLVESQFHLLTSGKIQNNRVHENGMFSHYSGKTLNSRGCPNNHPRRIHDVAPVKKKYEEIIQIVPRSCEEWKQLGYKLKGKYLVDPDGLEGEAPFEVDCFFADSAIMIIHHDQEARTRVKGYEDPGSFEASIQYQGVSKSQMIALMHNADYCEQFIKWECKGATLTNQGWWVNRDGQRMRNWGGTPKSYGCACGARDDCSRHNFCNCDANDDNRWMEDSGYLNDTKFLPVTKLRFGDTGNEKEDAYYTLGPLRCYSNKTNPNSEANAFMPLTTWPAFQVFCTFDGWLIIQRRSGKSDINFHRDWDDYVRGFGDLNGDYWLGLEKIHQITNQGTKGHGYYYLQIAFNAGNDIKLYAQYEYFAVDTARSNYRISFGDYKGTISNELEQNRDQPFTTRDRDHDRWEGGNCAHEGLETGGWWYADCGKVYLNGDKIVWGGVQVDSVEMKIRPMDY